MTPEQEQEIQQAVETLKRQMEAHARIIEDLQKNSHPPIDFIARIAQAVNNKELSLGGPLLSMASSIEITRASVRGG